MMRKRKPFTMHPHHLLGPVFAFCMIIAGCGGGTPTTQTDQRLLTCSLNWAWSNPQGQSGNQVKPYADVTWDNQTCAIQTATQASMTVCITHPALTELSLQLTRPDRVILTLPAIANASNTGNCRDGSSPYTYQLDAASLPSQQLNGLWNLRVTDTSPNNNQSGYLIGWSLAIQGRN
jgi:subtilisin-like proprotein convertase family protein